jgi:hypothetical protein
MIPITPKEPGQIQLLLPVLASPVVIKEVVPFAGLESVKSDLKMKKKNSSDKIGYTSAFRRKALPFCCPIKFSLYQETS